MNKSLVGGTVKKPLQITIIIVGVLVLLVGYWLTDNFIYPIKSVHPNYSDVEKSFAQLQFPADWKEISSSENKGLHGRDCSPSNNSGCFHKSKKFSVPDSLTNEDVKRFMLSSGCRDITENEFTYGGEQKRSFGFNCQLDSGVKLGLSLRGPESSLSVTTKTY